MSHTYEIEIKSLLGSEENAKALKEKLSARDIEVREKHSQLNHYFNALDDMSVLEEKILPHIEEGRRDALRRILEEGEGHSVRTREADGDVFFIIKASIDEGTSANTVSRIEFEEKVDLSLDELDQILLDAGLTYQAKWSREREEFRLGDTNITIDKNAGYGYLAEFERVVETDEGVGEVKQELVRLMSEFGVEELPQDRLERMFAHYNEHWEDYYGTDNIFVIE